MQQRISRTLVKDSEERTACETVSRGRIESDLLSQAGNFLSFLLQVIDEEECAIILDLWDVEPDDPYIYTCRRSKSEAVLGEHR